MIRDCSACREQLEIVGGVRFCCYCGIELSQEILAEAARYNAAATKKNLQSLISEERSHARFGIFLAVLFILIFGFVCLFLSTHPVRGMLLFLLSSAATVVMFRSDIRRDYSRVKDFERQLLAMEQ